MIPLKLTLYNFMSYKNPVPLDFSSFDLACLCGENGTGKSSILEAIGWVLWNKARSSPDALIHHGQETMWVDFEFQQDGKRYRVIRKRSKRGKGSSELDFLIYDNGWSSLAGATIKETEDKIAEVLKLPYEIFINSAYLKQGHADEFTTKPPSQRKEILGKILDLDFYELLSQKARDKIKSGEADEKALTTALSEIKENLKQKPLFEKELKKTEKILKEREKNLNEEKDKLERLRKDKNKYDLKAQKLETTLQQLKTLETEGKELKAEHLSVKAKIKAIERLIQNKADIEKGISELEKKKKENEQYNEKLSRLSTYKERLGAIKAKEEEINEKINKIKKIDRCPTCLRTLSKQEANKIIDELQQLLKKDILIALKKIENKIREIGYDSKKHQKIKEEINRLSHFEDEKRRLDLESKILSEKKEQCRKIEKELEKKRQRYRELDKHRAVLHKELDLLKSALEKFLQQERKVANFLEELLEIKGTYGAFSQRLSDLHKQEELYASRKKQLEEVKKEIEVYKRLSEIFSKKGLQTMIIETVLPEIENEANKLLEKITDGRMSVKFITSKEKKSGQGEIETLEIRITDNLGERGYEVYSGGETFRIDLAIRVALSKVLSKRAGTKLQFLAIDEGFGSLDAAGKDEVVDAICALKDDFKKILVSTHIQELKNLFPTRIEVTKDEEGSHLEVVSV